MSQGPMKINTVAPLRNVVALNTLVKKLKNRKAGMPGMGCFSGPSGFGKTMASVYVVIKHRCYHIELKQHWRRKTFCEQVAAVMGVKVKRSTITSLVDGICENLSVTQKPLLIDDSQFAGECGYLELVKDFYEGSGAPVVMIGEEDLPTEIARSERVHNRMLDWVQAEPTDVSDAKHLAALYCKDVTFSDDLIDGVVDASRGVARRVVVNLNNAADLAQRLGVSELSLSDWRQKSDRDFFTGQAPAARRGFK